MATFEVTQQNTIARAQTGKRRNFSFGARFASESELRALTSAWTSRRLVEIWNKLPGVTPVVQVHEPTNRGWPDLAGDH